MILRLGLLSVIASMALPVRAVTSTPPIGPFQSQCEMILANKTTTLNDLVNAGFIKQKSEFIFVADGDIPAHELRSATLLAARLQQPLALIPQSFGINTPAVDGILFDSLGEPVSNFSLKTISAEDLWDVNSTIKTAVRKAEKSIEDHYSTDRWRIISNHIISPKYGKNYRRTVHLARTHIFGVDRAKTRHVTIVIDYSEMPSAILRLTHTGLDGSHQTETIITLNQARNSLVEINKIIRKVRSNHNVKEYIFLGAHHLLRITEKGYFLDEFCDSLGHVHCPAGASLR